MNSPLVRVDPRKPCAKMKILFFSSLFQFKISTKPLIQATQDIYGQSPTFSITN